MDVRVDDESEEAIERWRMAGILLSRLNPVALRVLLLSAEIAVAQAPESSEEISNVDFVA